MPIKDRMRKNPPIIGHPQATSRSDEQDFDGRENKGSSGEINQPVPDRPAKILRVC